MQACIHIRECSLSLFPSLSPSLSLYLPLIFPCLALWLNIYQISWHTALFAKGKLFHCSFLGTFLSPASGSLEEAQNQPVEGGLKRSKSEGKGRLGGSRFKSTASDDNQNPVTSGVVPFGPQSSHSLRGPGQPKQGHLAPFTNTDRTVNCHCCIV